MKRFLRIASGFFLPLIGVLLSTAVFAQDPSQNQLSVSVAPNGGFVISHQPEMRHLIQGHTKGLAFTGNWRTSGDKYWHQAFLWPTLGVDVFINDLGNRDQLGIATSAIFFIQLPLNENPKFQQYFKPGIGLGYLTRRYDLESNSKNLAIGSKLNGAILLEYGCEILLSEKMTLVPGIKLTHFSNGSFQKPNLGINIPSLFVGLKWQVQEGTKVIEKLPVPETEKLVYSSFLGLGAKETYPPGGEKHLAYTWSNMVERRISFKSSVALGADVMYSGALASRAEEKGESTDEIKKMQIGAFLGYVLHFHKFRVFALAGVYALDEYKRNGIFYNRFGLRYNLNDHWEIGFHLKTHFAVADYFEIGLAYKF